MIKNKENEISIEKWAEIKDFIPADAYSSDLIKIVGRSKDYIWVIFKLELSECFEFKDKDISDWKSIYNDIKEFRQQCIESEYSHNITYLSYWDITPEELRNRLNKKYCINYIPGKFLVEFVKYFTNE